MNPNQIDLGQQHKHASKTPPHGARVAEATPARENPLLTLRSLGQAVWLDYIARSMIDSGELRRLIEQDGLCGVTSNPAIFDNAIAGSSDYDESIRALAVEGKEVEEIYESLTVADIQKAADLFRPVYDKLRGADGFASLEVNPHLAHDLRGTVEEARRLWKALNRPNVFIKVPATVEGLQAIRQLTGEGISVNVTLLFGLPRYRAVAEAYIGGLEDRAARSENLRGVSSVASFFLSRIDVVVDQLLERLAGKGEVPVVAAAALRGQAAIASAKVAYRIYQELFGSERFARLRRLGAQTQRVLWASTGTKNPAYSDVKYVEPLIGPETINTMPPDTLKAYRDHGHPASRLEDGVEIAEESLAKLAAAGIDIDQVTRHLENEGVEKFNKPYDSLLRTLAEKIRE